MGVNSVGLPIHKTKGKERLYLYDPGKKTWKRLSNKNVSVCATLARVGKKLYLVGNRDFTSEGGPNTVNAYDTKKGAKKKPLAQLPYNADNAKVDLPSRE